MKIKKQQKIASFLKTLKCVQPKRQLSFEKISEGVKNKELYGFMIVDIPTPEDLKYVFFVEIFFHYKEHKHQEKILASICRRLQNSKIY